MSSEHIPPFPGEDFAITLQNEDFTQQVYETGTVYYGHTTTGQTVTIPVLEYWAQTTSASGDMQITERASMITEEIMTGNERAALNRARVMKLVREQGQGDSLLFSPLRKVMVGKNGLLQLCSPQDSSDEKSVPFAAVKSLAALHDIDFVTPVRGPYNVFRYRPGEILSFAPQSAIDANAYRFIDHPRLLTGGPDNRKFQIAKIRLYRAVADLDYPLPEAR